MLSVTAPPALPLRRVPRHLPTSGEEFLVRRLLRIVRSKAGMLSVIAPPALPLRRVPRHLPTSGEEFLVRRLLRIARGSGPRPRTASGPSLGSGGGAPPSCLSRSRRAAPSASCPETR